MLVSKEWKKMEELRRATLNSMWKHAVRKNRAKKTTHKNRHCILFGSKAFRKTERIVREQVGVSVTHSHNTVQRAIMRYNALYMVFTDVRT